MKAAIFDMDGTLLNSMEMWHRLLPQFMEECNIVADSQFMKETSELGLFSTAKWIIERYNLNLDAVELKKHWDEVISYNYLNIVKLKPFALEYLSGLKAAGVKIAVATLTEHALADEALRHHGVAEFVDCILTTEDVGGVTKRHPDLFLEAARRLGVPPEDCVIFEDSYYAIPPAIKAGFTVYAIADDHSIRQQDDIKKISARYFVDWSVLVQELKDNSPTDCHTTSERVLN